MASDHARPAVVAVPADAGGMAMAILCSALMSTKPILIKLAYAEGLSADAVMGARMLISLPLFVVIGVFAYRSRPGPISARMLAATAFTGIIGFYAAAYFDMLALEHLSAQLERMILFISPTVVIILSAMLYGEAITARKIIALLLSYLGVVTVVGHEFAANQGNVALGIAFVVMAMLCLAVFLLGAKHCISQLGPPLYTSIALGAASIVVLLHLGVTGAYAELWVGPELLAILALLAIGATVLPLYAQSIAISRVGAGVMSVVLASGPPLTSAMAVLMLGEVFTIYHAAGLTLTGIGMVVLAWSPRGRRREVNGSATPAPDV